MSRPALLRTFLLALLLALTAASTATAAPSAKKLPANFLWGVSSSAFQSEGHTTNNNWNYYIQRDNGPNPVGKPKDPYGNSVDFYNHYDSDIALAAKLGISTYRISINWARIEPRRGVFSKSGLRFYDRVFASMRRHGVQPLITLNHWDYPMWVYKRGGWTNKKIVDDFGAMTKVIAKRYAHMAKYWLTFNEEFFFEFIEKGNFPLTDDQVTEMRRNLIAAHKRAYKIIHRASPKAMVSSNYAWPGRGPIASVETEPFLNAVKKQLDYVALDYYYPAYDQLDTLVKLSSGRDPEIALDPFGMYTALRSMHRQFPKLPILITENGFHTEDGQPREDGATRVADLQDNLYWVQRARQDGVPVIGYMYWSLTDVYQWGKYGPRSGLYTVDVLTDPTLTRRPTAAVPVFKRLVKQGGVAAAFTPMSSPEPANCDTASVAPQDRATCHAAAGS